jgi:hypothetical protein
MSYQESQATDNNTQPELTELYQNPRKPQAQTEQPKQPKSAITKGSTTDQLNDAVVKTQKKAKDNAIVNTKAVIVAGQNSGREDAKLFKKAKQLAFLNEIADDEIESAKALLVGIPEYKNAIDQASGCELENLLDFDQEISIEALEQQLNEAVGKSKKSQLAVRSFFGE